MAEPQPHTSTEDEFEERLVEELSMARRTVIIGVGNEFRGDDAAGPKVIRSLRGLRSRGLRVIDAGVVPENSAEEILRFKPSNVVLVDAVDASQPPGFTGILAESTISDVAVSTHRLPLTLLTGYLRSRGLDARFTFIGIQVKDVDLGSAMTPEVREAVRRVSSALGRALSHLARTGRVPHH